MENVILTAYRIGTEELAKPKVVHIPASAIKRYDVVGANVTGDRAKPNTTIVHVERTDGGNAIQYYVYESPAQIAVAMDPVVANNPYALDVTIGADAAGSAQGTATDISTYLTTVDAITADSADGVELPAAAANKVYVIINTTTTPLQVFPNSGDTVDGGSANAAKEQAGKSRVHYVAENDTNWVIAEE